MKNYIKIRKIILIVLLLLITISLVSCVSSNNKNNDNNNENDENNNNNVVEKIPFKWNVNLSGFKVDIQNAKSVGLMKKRDVNNVKTSIDKSSLAKLSATLINNEEDDGVVLVKLTKDDLLEAVELIPTLSEETSNDNFEFLQLYVADRFTYFSIIPKLDDSIEYSNIPELPKGRFHPLTQEKIYEEIDIDGISKFDKTNYVNSNVIKSYIFSNDNGQIYSLDSIDGNLKIDKIISNYILLNNQVKKIEIEEELLKLSSVGPTHIEVNNFLVDKHENVYLDNPYHTGRYQNENIYMFQSSLHLTRFGYEELIMTEDMEVISIVEGSEMGLGQGGFEIKIFDENGNKTNIDFNKEYVFAENKFEYSYFSEGYYSILHKIKNGIAVIYQKSGGGNHYRIINIEKYELKTFSANYNLNEHYFYLGEYLAIFEINSGNYMNHEGVFYYIDLFEVFNIEEEFYKVLMLDKSYYDPAGNHFRHYHEDMSGWTDYDNIAIDLETKLPKIYEKGTYSPPIEEREPIFLQPL